MLKKMTLDRKYKNAIRVGIVLYKAVQLFAQHCINIQRPPQDQRIGFASRVCIAT